MSQTKIVTNLDELDNLCRKQQLVAISKDFSIAVHRLTPAETARVAMIGRDVIPPVIKGEGGAEDKFDFSNPDYIRANSEARAKMRALTVYLGCPIVRDKHPGLTGTDEVQAAVESHLTETLLQQIESAIVSADANLEEQVNFFSNAGSRRS